MLLDIFERRLLLASDIHHQGVDTHIHSCCCLGAQATLFHVKYHLAILVIQIRSLYLSHRSSWVNYVAFQSNLRCGLPRWMRQNYNTYTHGSTRSHYPGRSGTSLGTSAMAVERCVPLCCLNACSSHDCRSCASFCTQDRRAAQLFTCELKHAEEW